MELLLDYRFWVILVAGVAVLREFVNGPGLASIGIQVRRPRIH